MSGTLDRPPSRQEPCEIYAHNQHTRRGGHDPARGLDRSRNHAQCPHPIQPEDDIREPIKGLCRTIAKQQVADNISIEMFSVDDINCFLLTILICEVLVPVGGFNSRLNLLAVCVRRRLLELKYI